jgi:hypothetical protein
VCWVLYLAADRPLPLVAFDPAAPAFNVTELTGREVAVRAQFRKPFAYSAGAHTSCGCGFDRMQANPGHPEELAATERSLSALRDYLARAVEAAGPLELFACWDGDQAAPPERRLALTPDDFGPAMEWLPDRTYASVGRAIAPPR